MTKDNKFKEKPKTKTLEVISKEEVSVLYKAVSTPKPGTNFSRRDAEDKESLFDKIMGDIVADSEGMYHFQNRDAITLTIPEHEMLLKDLDAPIFQVFEMARIAGKLIKRLKNIESVVATKDSDLEPVEK